MMNGACVTQILMVTDKIKLMQYMQEEMNACYRLFHCYLQHRWGTRCDVAGYQPNVQAPLFCYELEASMRLTVMMQSIQNEARKNGRVADQLASWVKMNQRGLRQRYAQELEKKCSTGTILFAKGDLYQLIHNVGGVGKSV